MFFLSSFLYLSIIITSNYLRVYLSWLYFYCSGSVINWILKIISLFCYITDDSKYLKKNKNSNEYSSE